MATKAQISANRRNALKSTGPRTSSGKAKSSRNAARQKTLQSVDPAEVWAMYFAITEKAEVGEVDDFEPASFRLAVAEVRLRHAQWKERAILLESDDVRRLLPEFDAVCDVLDAQDTQLDPISSRIRKEGHELKYKVQALGAKATKTAFRHLLRELREAEQEYHTALKEWIDQIGC